jgi:hypothetical protein
MELKENAFKTTGKNIILDIISKLDIPVIVSDFNTPRGQDYGDYVIIKKDLEKRSNNIRGEFMFEFSDGVNVYKLNSDGSSV